MTSEEYDVAGVEFDRLHRSYDAIGSEQNRIDFCVAWERYLAQNGWTWDEFDQAQIELVRIKLAKDRRTNANLE